MISKKLKEELADLEAQENKYKNFDAVVEALGIKFLPYQKELLKMYINNPSSVTVFGYGQK